MWRGGEPQWPALCQGCGARAGGNVVGFDLQCAALGTRRGRACPTTSRTHTRGAGLTPGAGDLEGVATATTTTPPAPTPGPTQPATSPRPSSRTPWPAWQSFRTVTLATCQPVKTPHPRVCPPPLPWALSVLVPLAPACLLAMSRRQSLFVLSLGSLGAAPQQCREPRWRVPALPPLPLGCGSRRGCRSKRWALFVVLCSLSYIKLGS